MHSGFTIKEQSVVAEELSSMAISPATEAMIAAPLDDSLNDTEFLSAEKRKEILHRMRKVTEERAMKAGALS